jgi:hypothetical protein
MVDVETVRGPSPVNALGTVPMPWQVLGSAGVDLTRVLTGHTGDSAELDYCTSCWTPGPTSGRTGSAWWELRCDDCRRI